MDRLKRQIGYVPSEKPVSKIAEVLKRKETSNPVTPPIKKEIPPTPKVEFESGEALRITNWIKTHPEFKWATMCKKVGISKGNFHRILQSETPNLKLEHIARIKLILKEYGYE